MPLSLLTDSIRTEHSYCHGKTVKAMNKLIDDTLSGYSYEEFGIKPIDNPDVLDPIGVLLCLLNSIG